MRYYHQQQSQARSFDRSQRREPESVTIMMFCSNCSLKNINSFLSFLLTQRIRRDRQSGRHDVSFIYKEFLSLNHWLMFYFITYTVKSKFKKMHASALLLLRLVCRSLLFSNSLSLSRINWFFLHHWRRRARSLGHVARLRSWARWFVLVVIIVIVVIVARSSTLWPWSLHNNFENRVSEKII